jgi:peptidyl-prolyl cis-trans isomerase A (cyclophilin A)
MDVAMSARVLLPLGCIVSGLLLAAQVCGEDKADSVHVLLRTDKGDIEMELDAARALRTTSNFLRYVDAKFYDGGRFHRTVTPDNQPDKKVKIEVIQAGIDPTRAKDEFPAIKLERTNKTGLAHKDGTISMARDGPDTATSDFFICIGDQPELDFGARRNPDGQGFAAFGRVVKGMNVVRKNPGGARRRADSEAARQDPLRSPAAVSTRQVQRARNLHYHGNTPTFQQALGKSP